MNLQPNVQAGLARLTPDQRAAATAPPGPVLCLAPAGSGKTTTLVARIAWLVATGTPAAEIAAIAFNKRAADELVERVDAALAPLEVPAGTVRVRTFHAFGREILLAAGRPVDPLVDREALLRAVAPWAGPAERRPARHVVLGAQARVSRDGRRDRGRPGRGTARSGVRRLRAGTGGPWRTRLRRPRRTSARPCSSSDPSLLHQWRSACRELLVDEVQDVDRSQLELALLIAAPANRIFLVGDDDQSIYGWRLADVRRVLAIAERLPGLRRHDLITNFRCPAPVVERAVRLVEHNTERFAKRIVARPAAVGRIVLAPDPADDDQRAFHVLASWSASPATDGQETQAILARTNRELLPAAAVALELGLPFRAERLSLPLEDPRIDDLLAAAEVTDDAPLLVRIAGLRERESEVDPADESSDDRLSWEELVAAALAWAAAFEDAGEFCRAVRGRREDLARLRRDDARLMLATAHSTKGLEFDHVAVVDMDAGRFPSQRSLDDADDPVRALEEERRLAYVAWTRARRSLTLVYDPAAPSPLSPRGLRSGAVDGGRLTGRCALISQSGQPPTFAMSWRLATPRA